MSMDCHCLSVKSVRQRISCLSGRQSLSPEQSIYRPGGKQDLRRSPSIRLTRRTVRHSICRSLSEPPSHEAA